VKQPSKTSSTIGQW